MDSEDSSSELLSVFIAANMALRVNKLHLVKCMEMLAEITDENYSFGMN